MVFYSICLGVYGMKVGNLTSNNLNSVVNSTIIKDVIDVMKRSNIDNIPVVDDQNRLMGIFTAKNIIEILENNISLNETVDKVMDKKVISVKGDDEIDQLFDIGLRNIPVVDSENRLVGMMETSSLLMTYYKEFKYIAEELKVIFENTHNGIIAVNREGFIININNSALKVIGRMEEEVLGKRLEDFFPGCRLRNVLQTGRPELGHKYTLNGLNIIVNRTPIIRNGEVAGAIATFQDVTELENTIKELSKEKNLTHILRTILENAYDGIVVVDKDGKISMINNSYAKFLNVNSEDVIGKHVTEVIENTRLHIILRTGEAEIGDVQKIGSHKIVAMRIPIKEDGKVVGAIGKIMFRDVQEVNSLAKRLNMIENELEYYKDELKRVRQVKYSFDNIPEKSYKIKKAKELAKIASKSSSTVLITGESGTGKELFAHSIHNASKRHLGPFIKMNCAAIPSELLESELFGYKEGAFTGAKKGGKIGKFQLANGGTIFLDEIGDMPIDMQAKILRVLQDKEIEPIGSNLPIKVDVRIIAATNRDLKKLIEDNKFREDLYYRLNVISVKVPPLRERLEDMEDLVNVLLKKHSKEIGKIIPGVSSEVIDIFKSYNWPGNVRELENIIERAVNVADSGSLIRPMHLPVYLLKGESLGKTSSFSLKHAVEDAEREKIIECLKYTNGNRVMAAKLLNISRSTLYEKLDKYGIKEV